MENNTILKDGFRQICVEKNVLEKPHRSPQDSVESFTFESKLNCFDGYNLYTNDSRNPDKQNSLMFEDNQYTLTFNKGVYNACVFPTYDDDDLLRNLRRNGLTLNQVNDFPYILLGNPTKDATIVVSNLAKYDFLSSYILDGLLDCVVDKGISSLDHCIVIIPNINLETLDFSDILEKYQYENIRFVEIEGSFKNKSHIAETYKDKDFRYTPSLKQHDFKISPNLNDDRKKHDEVLVKRNQQYLRVVASYWKLTPDTAMQLGYDIAKAILRQ